MLTKTFLQVGWELLLLKTKLEEHSERHTHSREVMGNTELSFLRPKTATLACLVQMPITGSTLFSQFEFSWTTSSFSLGACCVEARIWRHPCPSAPSGRVPWRGAGGNCQGDLEDTLLTGWVWTPRQGSLSRQLPQESGRDAWPMSADKSD